MGTIIEILLSASLSIVAYEFILRKILVKKYPNLFK